MGTPNSTTQERLSALRLHLEQVNRRWTVDNHAKLLAFYVRILPRALGVERCTIYMIEPGSERICSLYGTGIDGQEIQVPREQSVAGRVIATGQTLLENAMDERTGFHTRVDERTGFVTRNVVCTPIKTVAGQQVIGAIQALNKLDGDFRQADAEALEEVAAYLCMAMENILVNREILDISATLDEEMQSLRVATDGGDEFIAESAAMRGVLEQVRTIGKVPVNVLVQGENGTGKELIARMIHRAGERRSGGFVAVNCAAIPEALMESEFFGYRKGAFTGAVENRPGRFEEASGGTLFLDEIADLPMAMQPKFLRVLQEGEGTRLGDQGVRQYDLRIICASNKDLKQAVSEGRFREDLYYRLFSVEVRLPPLRERNGDILPMTLSFLERTAKAFDKHVSGLGAGLMETFERYQWPGNVRQLRREVERLVALTPEGESLELHNCSAELRGDAGGAASLRHADAVTLPARVEMLEIQLIRESLRQTHGNRARAAALLGITRQGLHKKMKRYGVEVG